MGSTPRQAGPAGRWSSPDWHSASSSAWSAATTPGCGSPTTGSGLFLLCQNLASSTLGSYGTYFLVTETGLTQSEATGLVLVTFPPALVMSVIFVRLADTVWRDRLFVVAMLLQIIAFATGALTEGTVLAGMVAVTVLYSLSNVFGGEAAYKVWSQLLFPAEVRATALGLTYGIARGAAAAFALVTPALVARDAAGLLWILTACVTVSGILGLIITRHPRLRRAYATGIQGVPEHVRARPDRCSPRTPGRAAVTRPGEYTSSKGVVVAGVSWADRTLPAAGHRRRAASHLVGSPADRSRPASASVASSRSHLTSTPPHRRTLTPAGCDWSWIGIGVVPGSVWLVAQGGRTANLEEPS